LRSISDYQRFFFERRLEEDEGEGVRVRTLAEILEEEEMKGDRCRFYSPWGWERGIVVEEGEDGYVVVEAEDGTEFHVPAAEVRR
jgi:hypothetical protein